MPLTTRRRSAAALPVQQPATTDHPAPESTVDRIVKGLRDGLRVGRYAPGQRLIESDLTATFGTSRGPVREALRRLVAEGALSQEHNRGIRVRRMSRDEVSALYRVRESLEGLAARLAAERIGAPGHRARLRQLARALDAAMREGDVERYDALNEQLHADIVRLGGNDHLVRLVDQLRLPLFRLQFRQQNALERTRRAHDDHRRLLTAILLGSADKAEAAMRRHIQNSAQYLAEMPAELFG